MFQTVSYKHFMDVCCDCHESGNMDMRIINVGYVTKRLYPKRIKFKFRIYA